MTSKEYSVAELFNIVLDSKSLAIFNYVFHHGSNQSSTQDMQYVPKDVMGKLGVTRKEYYSRISRMKRSGLIVKRDAVYSATSLGKVLKAAIDKISFYASNPELLQEEE
jgi:hypothetical protein